MKRLPILLAVILALALAPRLPAAPALSGGKSIVQYHVITNDWLIVSVFQEPDLQVKERVDAAGNINCQLVGQVHVFGLNIQETEKKLEDAYRNGRFLRHPKVTVSVFEYAPRLVSVQGHVKSPGRFPLEVETVVTLPDIITRAGGFDDTAKGDAVRVTRILPDGSTEVKNFDVKSLMQGKKAAAKNPAADFLLEPNDIVFVPQRII
jgi:polysaccharide export outer membrane protein